MKKTLTLTELAKYLSLNKRTLYRMLDNNRFPLEPIKGTKPRRWATVAVDAWLANGGVVQP